MKHAIAELIPELNQIQDAGLRDKVIAAYESALKQGGWQPEDMKKIPFTLLIPTDISYLDHTRAVTRTSIEAAKIVKDSYPKGVRINMDTLIAGAILHDVGKLLEYRSDNGKVVKSRSGKNLRHPFSGVGVAFGHGLPDEVLHIIAVHAKEGDSGWRSPEAIILHHADFTNFECLKESAGG